MDFTRPFELRAASPESSAVLLIHGFTGSPYELHLLGLDLHRRGYSCTAPLLAGHHQSLTALAVTRWPDWLASADKALHNLWQELLATRKNPRLAVVGLSMGGLLALELGRRYPAQSTSPSQPAISALSVLAAPLFLPAWQTRAILALSRLSSAPILSMPKLFGADIRERNREPPPLRPRGMPFSCLNSLLHLMTEVRGHLSEVYQPTLLCHGTLDHTAPYASMAEIAAGLGTPPAELRCLALPRSYHLVPLDVEREILFEAVAAHFDRYLNIAPTGESR